jgi:hypothetical protein
MRRVAVRRMPDARWEKGSVKDEESMMRRANERRREPREMGSAAMSRGSVMDAE